MARRRKRGHGAGDKLKGVFLAIMGGCLLAALAGIAFWVQASRWPIDSKTHCPKAGASAIHVVVFDRSDPISAQQAQHIRQALQRAKAEGAAGTRYDLYTFDGDSKNVLEPILSICAPARPEDANELVENRERIRRRYDEQFSKVLDDTVNDLLTGSTRSSSPIIESLRAAAQTSFGSYDAGRIPVRLMLISDMVQHTRAVSHLRSEPNFELLSRQADWASLRPQLKGADTTILYLLRPNAVRGATRVQNRGHQAFWQQLIAASGGRLALVDPF